MPSRTWGTISTKGHGGDDGTPQGQMRQLVYTNHLAFWGWNSARMALVGLAPNDARRPREIRVKRVSVPNENLKRSVGMLLPTRIKSRCKAGGCGLNS
jgi:hypothetical protein